MIVNGSFFDEAKANALGWEFNSEKGPKNNDWAKIAALVSVAASKKVAAAAGATVFLSGYASKDDKECLDEIATKTKKIHFPWVTLGWDTKEKALFAFGASTHVPEPKNKDDFHKVVFEVSEAQAFEFVKCRQVCHRLNGEITAAGEKKEGEDYTFYKVKAAALKAQTVKEWTDAKGADKGAAAGGAAAGTEAKPDDKPKEKEGAAEDKPEEKPEEKAAE
jgi:hypothetical protein